MKHTDRPALVPTALSHGVILWSGVFLISFGVACFAYNVGCRYAAARAALGEKSPTHIETELFAIDVPAEIARYSLSGNRLTMNVCGDRAVPLISIVGRRDPAFAYRALDLNPAFLAQRIEMLLKDEGVSHTFGPVVLSTSLRHTRHGQPAAFAYFKIGEWDGLATAFYVGDSSYCLVMVWDEEHALPIRELRTKVEGMALGAVWKVSPERIFRPVINSAELDAAEHARIVSEVGREQALWELHAARAKSEPEAALRPALEHFRRLLALRASVREERDLLVSDDFRLYEKLLERRAGVVRDWFLLLDKYEAVGDLSAAETQAEYIVRHATLEDESLARQRAAKALASVRSRLAAQAAEKKED